MDKLTLALVVTAPMLLLSGCISETVYYTPSYSTRYAYATGYNAPYWSNDAYFYGYNDVRNVGYWGMYDSYNVY